MSPRGPSFSLFYKQIFSSTPITSFVLFLLYIVVTPLMIGFEKDFLCHFHLGPIRIPPLFPFLPEPFPRNEKEDGTLELYYLSAYCLPKILLLQLAGHRVIQISRVFRGFPMLQLPYQFDRSGMDRLNIPLGSPVLTLLCGIHSLIPASNTSFSCSLHLLHCPQPFPVPLLKQNGFMFFHRLVIPLRSYLLIQFRSRLVHKIEWPPERQSKDEVNWGRRTNASIAAYNLVCRYSRIELDQP